MPTTSLCVVCIESGKWDLAAVADIVQRVEGRGIARENVNVRTGYQNIGNLALDMAWL